MLPYFLPLLPKALTTNAYLKKIKCELQEYFITVVRLGLVSLITTLYIRYLPCFSYRPIMIDPMISGYQCYNLKNKINIYY